MVGPSSSHTAGAVRIGLAARRILDEEPAIVDITLYNSYAKSYRGHKTDLAVLAGCLGFGTDDPRVRTSMEEAHVRGIRVNLRLAENAKYHPNTAVIKLVGHSGQEVNVRGISIGGGAIKIEAVNKEETALRPGTVRMCDACTTRCVLESENIPELQGLETARELVEAAESRGVPLSDLILEQECQAWGKPAAEVKDMVRRILKVMRDAVKNGLAGNVESIGGLIGNDAAKVHKAAQEGRLLGSPLYAKAIAWAMAVNETNAGMGVVAAAPTGGASGTLPGALLAAADTLGSPEEEVIAALITAGGMGARVAAQTSLSASVAGCQVEVGVAVGMAAAAVVQLTGGAPSQCANAMAIGIKAFMGLACDAPGGLVEVPCVKRNGIGAAAALAAADMALAGVKSQVPLDEVIWALADVGRHIPVELRDTMQAGLACTPMGKRVYHCIYGK